MIGLGILKGLGVTLKHFLATYWEDIKVAGNRYYTFEGVAKRVSNKGKGIFTIQYPEEKLPIPEEFRFLPFLIYDLDQEGNKVERCTACGICAKVCPPQCIWIERKVDPNTNRPMPASAEYKIDINLCMNCGLCAEYCPFNAIKMDHDFEIAYYEHAGHPVFDKEKLSKPVSYFAAIRPQEFSREEAAKAERVKKAVN
jgi:NADH-quinone oxidoreductase subunit I